MFFNSSGDIFVGTDDGAFRSSDNGDNWSQLGFAAKSVISFAVNSRGDIFTGVWDFPTDISSGIYRSTDNGEDWTQTEITDIVDAIVINSSDHIFAGSWEGLFLSTDNGDNWSPINSGLSITSINSLVLDYRGYVYAGTSAGGVFRSVKSTTFAKEIQEIPGSFSLDQNYPNPFNPNTTIEFVLPRSAHVTLAILNLMGQEITTLISEELSQGRHKSSGMRVDFLPVCICIACKRIPLFRQGNLSSCNSRNLTQNFQPNKYHPWPFHRYNENIDIDHPVRELGQTCSAHSRSLLLLKHLCC